MAINTSALTHKEITKRFFGLSRNMIKTVSLNQFHIPQDYRNCFIHMKLKHFTGVQFTNHMRDGLLYDPETRTSFTIIYQDCTPFHVKRAHEVLCSFRICWEELHLDPIVIVRISKNGENLK